MSLITVPCGITAATNLLDPVLRDINISDISSATAFSEITQERVGFGADVGKVPSKTTKWRVCW